MWRFGLQRYPRDYCVGRAFTSDNTPKLPVKPSPMKASPVKPSPVMVKDRVMTIGLQSCASFLMFGGVSHVVSVPEIFTPGCGLLSAVSLAGAHAVSNRKGKYVCWLASIGAFGAIVPASAVTVPLLSSSVMVTGALSYISNKIPRLPISMPASIGMLTVFYASWATNFWSWIGSSWGFHLFPAVVFLDILQRSHACTAELYQREFNELEYVMSFSLSAVGVLACGFMYSGCPITVLSQHPIT